MRAVVRCTRIVVVVGALVVLLVGVLVGVLAGGLRTGGVLRARVGPLASTGRRGGTAMGDGDVEARLRELDEPGPSSLATILDLVEVAPDHLRGVGTTRTRTGRMFGGDVAAQALAAAHATVPDDRPVHSLHGYFLLGGDPTAAVEHHVDRVRDGGSFTTRTVRSEQHDRAIFTMTASFQRPEDGLEHQLPVLEVTAPQDSPDLEQTLAREDAATAGWLRVLADAFPWEFRFPEPPPRPGDTEPGRTWFRVVGDLPDDRPSTHAAALVHASDLFLLGAAFAHHDVGFGTPGLFVTSLDHSVWFHAPVRVDDWLLYDRRSAWAGGGRALCRGRFWRPDGTLVATIAQEGLVRVPDGDTLSGQ